MYISSKELTQEERRFLDRAIKKSIRRVAELKEISLSDLQNVKLC